MILRGLAIHHKRVQTTHKASSDSLHAAASIRQTDEHFAGRITAKYGWRVSSPTARRSLIYRLNAAVAKSETHHVELAFHLQQVNQMLRTTIFANEWMKQISQQAVNQLRTNLAPTIVHKLDAGGGEPVSHIATPSKTHSLTKLIERMHSHFHPVHQSNERMAWRPALPVWRDMTATTHPNRIVDRQLFQLTLNDQRASLAQLVGTSRQPIAIYPETGMTAMIVHQGVKRRSDVSRLETSIHHIARMMLADETRSQEQQSRVEAREAALTIDRTVQHSSAWPMWLQAQALLSRQQVVTPTHSLMHRIAPPSTNTAEQIRFTWLTSSTSRVLQSAMLQRWHTLTRLISAERGQQYSSSMTDNRTIHQPKVNVHNETQHIHPQAYNIANEQVIQLQRLPASLHVKVERVMQVRMLQAMLQQVTQRELQIRNRSYTARRAVDRLTMPTQHLADRTHSATNRQQIWQSEVVERMMWQLESAPVHLISGVSNYVRTIHSVLSTAAKQVLAHRLANRGAWIRGRHRVHERFHTRLHNRILEHLKEHLQEHIYDRQERLHELNRTTQPGKPSNWLQNVRQSVLHEKVLSNLNNQHELNLLKPNVNLGQIIRKRRQWQQNVNLIRATRTEEQQRTLPTRIQPDRSRAVRHTAHEVEQAATALTVTNLHETRAMAVLRKHRESAKLVNRAMAIQKKSIATSSKISTQYQAQLNILQQAVKQSTITAVLKQVVNDRTLTQIRTTMQESDRYIRFTKQPSRPQHIVRMPTATNDRLRPIVSIVELSNERLAEVVPRIRLPLSRAVEERVDRYGTNAITREARQLRERERLTSLEHIEQVHNRRSAAPRITVSRKQSPIQSLKLDVASQPSAWNAKKLPSPLLESMQSAIQTLQKELSETKSQMTAPDLNIHRLTDQLYKEFTRRLRFEQQRRGR